MALSIFRIRETESVTVFAAGGTSEKPGRVLTFAAAALLLLAVCARPASAQLAQPAPNVTGRVIDAFSMGPLAGARVTAGPTSAVTDREGRFALSLPRGTALLVIVADGHLTEQVEVAVGDVAPPDPPAGLVATPIVRDVRLTWDRSPEPDVVEYVVLREDEIFGIVEA